MTCSSSSRRLKKSSACTLKVVNVTTKCNPAEVSQKNQKDPIVVDHVDEEIVGGACRKNRTGIPLCFHTLKFCAWHMNATFILNKLLYQTNSTQKGAPKSVPKALGVAAN